jgi:hypothetical protein
VNDQPPAEDDLVSVDQLDAVDRAYVRTREMDEGRVSRRAVTARRRAQEGRAEAEARENNSPIRARFHTADGALTTALIGTDGTPMSHR